MSVNFLPIRPTVTGGGGRAAGDRLKYKEGSANYVRCYICGFIVNTERDECPFCESDNFRGAIRKTVK